jgi:hypothetical protein
MEGCSGSGDHASADRSVYPRLIALCLAHCNDVFHRAMAPFHGFLPIPVEQTLSRLEKTLLDWNSVSPGFPES